MRITYREHLLPADNEAIYGLLKSTGVFYQHEIDVALELVNAFHENGTASGYYFMIAEYDEKLLGYACFGPTPCTRSSWDVYWIAVNKEMQGMGIGSILMTMAESKISREGGEIIWVDTSSRPDYKSTRQFYKKMEYQRAAELHNFYAPGDHKIIFSKVLAGKSDEEDDFDLDDHATNE